MIHYLISRQAGTVFGSASLIVQEYWNLPQKKGSSEYGPYLPRDKQYIIWIIGMIRGSQHCFCTIWWVAYTHNEGTPLQSSKIRRNASHMHILTWLQNSTCLSSKTHYKRTSWAFRSSRRWAFLRTTTASCLLPFLQLQQFLFQHLIT